MSRAWAAWTLSRFFEKGPKPREPAGGPASHAGRFVYEWLRDGLKRAISAEREPDRARALTEARDLLLSPALAIQRRLGVLLLPDPAAYGAPSVEAPEELPDHKDRNPIPLRKRVLAQLFLYALLEDEWRQSPDPQGELPFQDT